jgi:hypothetical protein
MGLRPDQCVAAVPVSLRRIKLTSTTYTRQQIRTWCTASIVHMQIRWGVGFSERTVVSLGYPILHPSTFRRVGPLSDLGI